MIEIEVERETRAIKHTIHAVIHMGNVTALNFMLNEEKTNRTLHTHKPAGLQRHTQNVVVQIDLAACIIKASTFYIVCDKSLFRMFLC